MLYNTRSFTFLSGAMQRLPPTSDHYRRENRTAWHLKGTRETLVPLSTCTFTLASTASPTRTLCLGQQPPGTENTWPSSLPPTLAFLSSSSQSLCDAVKRVLTLYIWNLRLKHTLPQSWIPVQLCLIPKPLASHNLTLPS